MKRVNATILSLTTAFVLASPILALTPALADDAGTKNAIQNPIRNEGSWVDIKEDIIGDTQPGDGSASFNIEAPVRAEDAAIVPIRIVKKPGSAPIDELKLIIDENPSPVAGDFKFGKAMDPLDFETRIRVNQYSNVRVVAEADGKFFMDGRFVKASGGCSAPASKDPKLALEGMGKMRLKEFQPKAVVKQSMPRRSAQLMIRHPNYSGLQRDQITQLFVPALFINHLEVSQGKDLLFSMEGGISISENPVFRFDYTDNGDPYLNVKASDTDGHQFEVKLDKSMLN